MTHLDRRGPVTSRSFGTIWGMSQPRVRAGTREGGQYAKKTPASQPEFDPVTSQPTKAPGDYRERLEISDERCQELRDRAERYTADLTDGRGAPSKRHDKYASALLASISNSRASAVSPQTKNRARAFHVGGSPDGASGYRSRANTKRPDRAGSRKGCGTPSPVVLDSTAIWWLAREKKRSAAVIAAFATSELWPFVVPSVVLARCSPRNERDRDRLEQFLAICQVVEKLARRDANRAGQLLAGMAYAPVEDAVAVATAEAGCIVLARYTPVLDGLASLAVGVTVHPTKRKRRQ